jgi:hypothetical protein
VSAAGCEPGRTPTAFLDEANMRRLGEDVSAFDQPRFAKIERREWPLLRARLVQTKASYLAIHTPASDFGPALVIVFSDRAAGDPSLGKVSRQEAGRLAHLWINLRRRDVFD